MTGHFLLEVGVDILGVRIVGDLGVHSQHVGFVVLRVVVHIKHFVVLLVSLHQWGFLQFALSSPFTVDKALRRGKDCSK